MENNDTVILKEDIKRQINQLCEDLNNPDNFRIKDSIKNISIMKEGEISNANE